MPCTPVLVLLLVLAPPAPAAIPEVDAGTRLEQLVNRLADPARAAAALDEALEGPDAAETLGTVAASDADIAVRGWAIAGLARLSDGAADALLVSLDSDGQPALVRSWSVAARIQRAASLEDLIALAGTTRGRAELYRPFGLRATALGGGSDDLPALLALVARNPDLQGPLAATITAIRPSVLIPVIYRAEEDPTRRLAAGYAAARGRSDPAVAEAVIQTLAFDPMARDVPWRGGALYVPNVGWSKEVAQPMVRHLIAWRVWCETRGKTAETTQIYNNLRSVDLLSAAGYGRHVPNDSVHLLDALGTVMGRRALRELIDSLGLRDEPRYRALLEAR